MLADFLRRLGQFNQSKLAPSLAILGIVIFIASFFFPPSIPVVIPLLVAVSLVVSGGLALVSHGFFNWLADKVESKKDLNSNFKKKSKNQKTEIKENELTSLLKKENKIKDQSRKFIYYFRDTKQKLDNYQSLEECSEEDKNIKILETDESKTVKQIKEIIAEDLNIDINDLSIYGRKLNSVFSFWEDKENPKDEDKKLNPNKLYSVRFSPSESNKSENGQQNDKSKFEKIKPRFLKVSQY